LKTDKTCVRFMEVLQEHQMVIMCGLWSGSTIHRDVQWISAAYDLQPFKIHSLYVHSDKQYTAFHIFQRNGGKSCVPRNIPTVLQTLENGRRNKCSKLVSVCKLRLKQIFFHARWYSTSVPDCMESHPRRWYNFHKYSRSTKSVQFCYLFWGDDITNPAPPPPKTRLNCQVSKNVA
jgi:hypothetical protein